MVKSKEQFFDEILPKAKKIMDDFLGSEKPIEVLNNEYKDNKHPDIPKNKKTQFFCEYCQKRIVGEKEKKIHLNSKKHVKTKRAKLRKAENDNKVLLKDKIEDKEKDSKIDKPTKKLKISE